MSSSAPAAPGSPAGRKMTKPVSTNAPKRKKKGLRELQMPGARNLFDSGALGMEGSTQKPMAGGRRRRKSKRKSHKKSHKKRRTKKRRKSRKKKSKRRRRR